MLQMLEEEHTATHNNDNSQAAAAAGGSSSSSSASTNIADSTVPVDLNLDKERSTDAMIIVDAGFSFVHVFCFHKGRAIQPAVCLHTITLRMVFCVANCMQAHVISTLCYFAMQCVYACCHN
jgi:hypothetical protein